MTRETDHDGTSDEPTGEAQIPRPDGGAVGADDVVLDPWGSATIEDYRKLFTQFGIEEFDEILPEVPNPHYLMRRGIIFGHRDYRPVVEAMRKDDPVAVLSGFMPTGDPHIGHKMVFDEIIWHQQQGADAFGLIADLEAHAARGLSWEEIDEHARNYLLSLLALGFDPEDGTLYRQSTNRTVQDLTFELGIEANFSELQAIYGFDGETDVSHMQSVVTQAADILLPQLEEPKPTVIPVGPDQDPHIRLTRDLAARMRFFKVTAAYLSQELSDEERPIATWLDQQVSRSFLSSVENQEPVDVEGGTLGFINCKQASVLLRNLKDFILKKQFEKPTNDLFNIDDLLETEVDYSRSDWKIALEEFSKIEDHTPDISEEELKSLTDKLKEAGEQPFRRRIRFLNRKGTDEAFESLIKATKPYNQRAYGGHIDVFDIDSLVINKLKVNEAPDDISILIQKGREAGNTLAREVEIENGGYGFYAPSSIYHRFMTGLTGGKMSSSVPASHISLLDDPEDGYQKVKEATTGGRETAELQRELGGEADKCPVYELYAYLLAGDDDEFATRVYEECVGGDRLCGDCKEEAANLMREFLADHQDKREELEPVLENLDIPLESPRRRV